VIFPFEQDFYKQHGVDVSYVGHPLAYAPAPEVSREEFAAQNGLNAAKTWIALLPGSRKKEVLLNLPEMVASVRTLAGSGDYEFVLPVASTLDRNWMSTQLAGTRDTMHLTTDSRLTLQHARAAVVASGTATVEAALAGTPFVVVYRLAPLTWLLGRRLVNLDTFAMPNLIAGRRIVTELIQKDFTAANVARELNAVIPDDAARTQMIKDLKEVQEKLRDSGHTKAPAVRAAQEILGLLT
jgi:lipid-A-disaccharide synthase